MKDTRFELMIEPSNELELITRFAQEAKETGFEIISCDGKFPDGIVSYEHKEYRVEFEYKSKNFWLHKHNPLECDLIICWIDDDEFSVLPVLELSNPDWVEKGIEKIPIIERNASYWKRRALEAEEQNHIKINSKEEQSIDYSSIPHELEKAVGRPSLVVDPKIAASYFWSNPQNISISMAKKSFGLSRDGHNLTKNFTLQFVDELKRLRSASNDQHWPTEKQEKILRIWDADNFEGVDTRSVIGKIAIEAYGSDGGRQRELVEKTLVNFDKITNTRTKKE